MLGPMPANPQAGDFIVRCQEDDCISLCESSREGPACIRVVTQGRTASPPGISCHRPATGGMFHLRIQQLRLPCSKALRQLGSYRAGSIIIVLTFNFPGQAAGASNVCGHFFAERSSIRGAGRAGPDTLDRFTAKVASSHSPTAPAFWGHAVR